MRVFCALYGHWPTPFSSRRRFGETTCRCWLCQGEIVNREGAWRTSRGDARSLRQRPA